MEDLHKRTRGSRSLRKKPRRARPWPCPPPRRALERAPQLAAAGGRAADCIDCLNSLCPVSICVQCIAGKLPTLRLSGLTLHFASILPSVQPVFPSLFVEHRFTRFPFSLTNHYPANRLVHLHNRSSFPTPIPDTPRFLRFFFLPSFVSASPESVYMRNICNGRVAA